MNHRICRSSLLVLAASGIALAGCAATLPFPAALHPSARPDQDAAGIAMGASYVSRSEGVLGESDFGSSSIQIPYGEGYVRFGGEKGQTEVRVTPGLGFVSYRADLTQPDAGMVFSVVPSLGFGRVSMRANGESINQMTLAPNLSAIFLLVDRTLYLSPRVGYAWANNFLFEEESAHAWMVGGTVGYLMAGDSFHTSVELSVTRLVMDEDSGGDAAWAIVPSLGITRL